MENDQPELWQEGAKIEHEINLGTAIHAVHHSDAFFKDLFLHVFRKPMEDFQNRILLLERAFAADTLLRKIYLLQKWFTIFFIGLLVALRSMDIWLNGYQSTKTIFDIGLTCQAILFIGFTLLTSKVNRENYLRLSETRQRLKIAEGLLCCHQALLNIMDESGFPIPNDPQKEVR